MQHTAKRHFVHEHPWAADSLNEQSVKDVVATLGVIIVQTDMCRSGLEVQPGAGLNEKRAGRSVARRTCRSPHEIRIAASVAIHNIDDKLRLMKAATARSAKRDTFERGDLGVGSIGRTAWASDGRKGPELSCCVLELLAGPLSGVSFSRRQPRPCARRRRTIS